MPPLFFFARRRATSLAVLLLAGTMAACSPTYNWRDVRLGGTALRAQLPCKPERAERPVPLTAAGTTLQLASCQAGGHTFVLAAAPLGTDDVPEAVLDRWQRAAWASVGAQRVPPAPAPSGWTPAPHPVRGAQQQRGWQGSGQDHRGQRIEARQLYLVHAGVAYQAAVYAPTLSAAAVSPFFDALSLPSTP